MLCCAVICYDILYYTILYYTILYYTILYYTILYYTILYYTILYYTILYYTVLYNTYTYIYIYTYICTYKDLRDLLPPDGQKASIFWEASSLVDFLQVCGLALPGSGQMTCINEVGKTMTYIGFRVGGLGYGPRFRCRDATYRKQVPGKPETLMALSALQVSDAADDWEAALQFHPGVLDGLLQSGTAYS